MLQGEKSAVFGKRDTVDQHVPGLVFQFRQDVGERAIKVLQSSAGEIDIGVVPILLAVRKEKLGFTPLECDASSKFIDERELADRPAQVGGIWNS